MFKLGRTSLVRRETCDPRLQEIIDEALNFVNFSVLCGYRSAGEQNETFEQGKSKLKFPDSKHNSLPSKAMDLAPYPLEWANRERFCYLAGIVMAIAKQKGIRLRWGGDWNGDGELADNKFSDLPHFELID